MIWTAKFNLDKFVRWGAKLQQGIWEKILDDHVTDFKERILQSPQPSSIKHPQKDRHRLSLPLPHTHLLSMASSLCCWNTGSFERYILWAQWLFEVFSASLTNNCQVWPVSPLWIMCLLPLVWLGLLKSRCRATGEGWKPGVRGKKKAGRNNQSICCLMKKRPPPSTSWMIYTDVNRPNAYR